jgi:hypothetical protein
LLKHWHKKVVVRELETLLFIRALNMVDGFLMCGAMVRTEADRIKKLAPEKLKEKDKVFEKFFSNFQKQMANPTPFQSSPNGSGTRSAQEPNSKQMATSNEATSNEYNELRVASSSNASISTDNNSTGCAGAAPSSSTGKTTTTPSAAPAKGAGEPSALAQQLTTVAANYNWDAAKLIELAAKHPQLDISAVLAKWDAQCNASRHAKTWDWFVGFVEHERPAKATKAAPKPKKAAAAKGASKEEVAAAVAKQHEEALRNMPGLGGEAEDVQEARIKCWFTHGNIPGEYDADELLCYCYDNKLFELYTPDSSQSEDDSAVAGANMVVKDEHGIQRLKGSKWLVPGAYVVRATASGNVNVDGTAVRIPPIEEDAEKLWAMPYMSSPHAAEDWSKEHCSGAHSDREILNLALDLHHARWTDDCGLVGVDYAAQHKPEFIRKISHSRR